MHPVGLQALLPVLKEKGIQQVSSLRGRNKFQFQGVNGGKYWKGLFLLVPREKGGHCLVLILFESTGNTPVPKSKGVGADRKHRQSAEPRKTSTLQHRDKD